MANIRKSISEERPFVSHSMGVHPRDAEKCREAMKRHGCDCTVNERGQAMAFSQKGRNDAMKFFGVGDRDGGYGDHTG